MNPAEYGFANVARWVADDPDGEALVFRKFDRLAARNLLHLQARMMVLEKEIHDLDKVIFEEGDMTVLGAAWSWEQLVQLNRKDDCPPRAKELMSLNEELRHAIKDYHEALALQHKISNLACPNKRAVEAYRKWLRNPRDAPLGGLSIGFLDDDNDLVALKIPPDGDHLSELLRQYWPSSDKQPESGSNNGAVNVVRFSDRAISKWANVISTFVAILLLIGPITCLSLITNPVVNRVLIAVFTVLFAASLGLITNAKRPDVFAATAAYAAVLVVFVSNQEMSNQSTR